MHGEQETSYAPRTTGVVLDLCFLGVAGWILLGGGVEVIGSAFHQDWTSGDLFRRTVLFAFGCILFVRLLFTSYWLLKRRFDWSELFGVAFACALYQIGFALLGAAEDAPLGIVGVAGIGLFVLGSYLNTWSEIQRKRFKDDPANKGRLYTGGLFAYARHINYFGDTLWVAGWAMVTGNAWSAVIPVALAAGFVFFFIPSLSQYLRKRYGDQYDDWAGTTKKFVPFVY
jgi:protein-S-isoprenylcysteine O-methyltransferase Ste14